MILIPSRSHMILRPQRCAPYLALLALLIVGCNSSAGSDAPRERPVLVESLVSSPDSTTSSDTLRFSDGGSIGIPVVMQRILSRRDSLWERALKLHFDAIVIDGHVDTPTLMLEEGYQFTDRHKAFQSHVDLPRMYEGGLDAAFMSLYVPPGYGEGASARNRVLSMIDVIEEQTRRSADSASIAYSVDDVVRITRSGRKALLLGLEGGHALGASDSVLAMYYRRGVRYVTLTHINSNSFADASQGVPRWNGLNDRGRALVRSMNRMGMIVDLSHASDSTFYDAIEVSRAPVLLSHSSVRAITPNVRNVDDAMLRALAKNGGVIMINFFDAMVNPALGPEVDAEVRRRLPGPSLTHLWNVVYEVKREMGLPSAQLEHVVDHIDHAVRIAGIDHVGLGSDFDGVFDLPGGLEDVTRLPWITYELVARGYSDYDVRKILGGNLLRLMQEVEASARN